MQAGTKEIKEVVDLVSSSYVAYGLISADGKVDWKDIGALLAIAPKVWPALEGITEVPKELSDLDEAEATELVNYTMEKFSVSNEKALLIAQSVLTILAALYKIYTVIKGK